MERTREIGILKALGSTRLGVLRQIEVEAAVMAVLGAILGVGITFGTKAILHYISPTLQIRIGSDWVAKATLLALVASPSERSIRLFEPLRSDPIEALAYE